MKRACSLLLLCLLFGCARGSRPPLEPAASAEAAPAVDETDEPEDSADVDALAKELEDEYADEGPAVGDPVKPWNVVWFHFNDKLYFWVVKPVSKAYGLILYPRPVRLGIRNVIINVGFPGRFFNTLFQGRPKDSGSEILRFVTNVTIGVLGLWDPATRWFHLELHEEDFDQTLGVWGLGMGFYITWPVVGPSSIRGTVGSLGESVLNPIQTYWAVRLVNRINNTSLDLDEYETLKKMAVDPYSAVRNAYVQNRREQVEEK
jgi:phospholipid-binding lipoprotein MlaA